MIDRGGKRFPRKAQKPCAFGVAERDALGFRESQRAEQRRRGQPEQRNEKQRRKRAQAEKRGREQPAALRETAQAAGVCAPVGKRMRRSGERARRCAKNALAAQSAVIGRKARRTSAAGSMRGCSRA
ncbi:MAG: hypothetical protein ACLVB5_07430 [Christensenellales bacterium]